MATAAKNRDKTLWTLGLLAILGFLTWKLWPALRNKLNGGGGSGGGGGPVGGIPGGGNPYGQQGGGSGGGFGAGPSPNSNAGGGNSGNFLSNWINSVLNQGYANAAAIDPNSITDSDFANELATLDSSGLNLPAPSSDDETWGSYLGTQDGEFLQTFDTPGDYQDSGFGYDYNGGADTSGGDTTGGYSGDYQDSGFGYGGYGGEDVPGDSGDPNTSYYS